MDTNQNYDNALVIWVQTVSMQDVYTNTSYRLTCILLRTDVVFCMCAFKAVALCWISNAASSCVFAVMLPNKSLWRSGMTPLVSVLSLTLSATSPL